MSTPTSAALGTEVAVTLAGTGGLYDGDRPLPTRSRARTHLRYLTAQLGLPRDADLVHHSLSCAGNGAMNGYAAMVL